MDGENRTDTPAGSTRSRIGRGATPTVEDGAGSGAAANYLDWALRGRTSIPLYLLAIVMSVPGLILGAAAVFIVMRALGLSDPSLEQTLGLFGFTGLLVLVPLIVRVLLDRPGWSVAEPWWPPRWGNYALGAGITWAAMAIASVALSPFTQISYVGWGTGRSVGAAVLVLLIVGLMVQTAAEEVLFRGLVTQAVFRFARRLPQRVAVGLALVLPSLWFALLHVGNIEAYGGGVAATIPYFIVAMTFAWAARRTGSVLTAMGVHFGNNSFLIFAVATPGDVLTGPAPFQTGGAVLWLSILFGIIQTGLVCAGVEWAVRRRSKRPVTS
jgi:hypothetical protein